MADPRLDAPWLGDTCSLVDAFRRGERSPVEELEASLAAIEASDLNAFSFVDPERALEAARAADVSLPFGGVPMGVKELDHVAGWPDTEASLVFQDRVASYDGTMVARLRDRGGANLIGLTTASEFGGLNVSVTKLNGITGNPWDPTRTAGGSSGGSASAVAGGLVTIATGGDGGGSIRIPAGFNGLVGMKGTVGRIPRGPRTTIGNMTVNVGCLARSVRDVARWWDVCSGYDSRDPYSLPRVDGWEAGLDTHDLAGLRVAIVPTLGGAVIRPELAELVVGTGEMLTRAAGLTIVDGVEVSVPNLGFEWAMSGLASLLVDLGDRWPGCKDDLTAEMAFGMTLASDTYNLQMAAQVDIARTRANEAVADLFDQVDLVICATNPDAAYPAHIGANTRVGAVKVGLENNGALTFPANISGVPSIAVPIGLVDDLPVSMQIMGRHHTDALLFDLARVLEREQAWPLVAPGAPA
jgi:Asp-tRNA(Asn)/Glu-tRNA(Gln) amidotransferase A subunit family amidase